jgi:maltokinase
MAIDREVAEHLLGYITGARWFAGKGRRAELARLTPLPWLTDVAAWPALRFEVAEIRYLADQDPDDADSEREVSSSEIYQLAVSYRSAPQSGLQHAEIGRAVDPDLGPVVAYDAMQDPQACGLILDRLLNSRRFSDGDSRVSSHLVSTDALSPDLEARIYTGQQSNTSVMYGDVAMLKLFRRLEIGHNLDIEIHESLSRSGVADVAQLYGWIEASWPGSADSDEALFADLAMVVEKLADAEDGWELALDTLRSQRGFAERAKDLGRALAEIHSALRTEFPTTEVSGAEVAAVMRARLAKAVAVAPALEPHLDALLSCFDALGRVELGTQRVHGDFHLGQTLHTPSGWKIIDFEGEPVKSLAERAEPDSVWRDIAGMMRSFDYAAASVPGPGSHGWAADCRAAFLAGYAGGALAAADETVLRAYEADKAVYEVVYEVRNRPDWVHIPLAAVAVIAAASAAQHRSTDTAVADQPTTPAGAGRQTASATAEQVKE